jgi:integrase
MAIVYRRGRVLWVKAKGLKRAGKWDAEPTIYRVGQEVEAKRYAAELQRGLDARADATGPGGMPTVAAYLARWTAERAAAGLRSADEDRRRLERHAMPRLGSMRLDEVRPRHVRELVRALKGAGELAPRTQLHVFRSLHTMFESARIDELIEANPAVVKPRELPKKRDKDPEWRQLATYTTDEVERLVSDERIPVERRVQYALKAIAGLRHGEVAALRWRHVDRDVEPLGRLAIAWSHCSRTRTIKPTKSEDTRAVPIHPTLARVLAAWRLLWPTVYGRALELDDLVVPARTMRPIAAADAGHALKADLGALGLRVAAGAHRDRGGHDLRGWYLTQTIVDGADPVLLRRTTHAAPTDVAGGYERYGWAAICREVGKLRVSILDGQVLAPGTGRGTASRSAAKRWRKSATPTGFEGVSGSAHGSEHAADPGSCVSFPHASDVTRGSTVPDLVQRLAEAVLAGDEVTARRLALEMRVAADATAPTTASPDPGTRSRG